MTNAGMAPWLSREGKFGFELGLRQGDESFFGPSADHVAILTARRTVLESHPDRHAALLDEGVPLLGDLNAWRGTHLPLLELGMNWEPDFLLLKPDAEGVHRLAGGCVCFPSSWDLHEKLGLPIEAIHAPVPTLNNNLGIQISTFLRRIKPGAVWERWNWGIAAVADLNHHPALQHPKLHGGSTLADSWLRIEHQAFRSLNAHGGLLFAIRISVLCLADLAQQLGASVRLAELLETMPDGIAAYKGLTEARAPLARQLRDTGGKPH